MKHVQEEVKVRVFRRRTQEEAELDDRAAGGDAPSLDGKADKAVDSVVAALECVRVLLRRCQLSRVQKKQFSTVVLTAGIGHVGPRVTTYQVNHGDGNELRSWKARNGALISRSSEKERRSSKHTMSAIAPPASQMMVLGKNGKRPATSCRFAIPAAIERVAHSCAIAICKSSVGDQRTM